MWLTSCFYIIGYTVFHAATTSDTLAIQFWNICLTENDNGNVLGLHCLGIGKRNITMSMPVCLCPSHICSNYTKISMPAIRGLNSVFCTGILFSTSGFVDYVMLACS